MTYQPRYLAYCAAHGLTPEEMLARGRAENPNASMLNFILWASRNPATL